MRPPARPRRGNTGAHKEQPQRATERAQAARTAVEDSAGASVVEAQAPVRVSVTQRLKSAALETLAARSERGGDGGEDRFAQRRKEIRRVRMRWFWSGIAVLAVVALLVWAVVFSPLFALRAGSLKVSGQNQYTDMAGVNAAVGAQVGTPLLRINTTDLENKLVGLRGVGSARVARQWPGGLTVNIQASVPVACAPQEKRWVILDSGGTVLDTVDKQPGDLPVLAIPLGDERSAPAMRALMSVLDVMPSQLRGQVVTASASSVQEIEFITRDKRRILWGDAGDNALKNAVVKALLTTPAKYIDVSAPKRPITK